MCIAILIAAQVPPRRKSKAWFGGKFKRAIKKNCKISQKSQKSAAQRENLRRAILKQFFLKSQAKWGGKGVAEQASKYISHSCQLIGNLFGIAQMKKQVGKSNW